MSSKPLKQVLAGASLATLLFFVAFSQPSSANNAAAKSFNTKAALKSADWNEEISLIYEKNKVVLTANGIPGHKRDAQYALPQAGVMVPDASTSAIGNDPTKEQSYNFEITTKPKYISKTTSAPLGSIGLMISGSVLFNPYEGDNETVAMANNFYLTDTQGNKVWFIDSCSAHPTPIGEYHYHALSTCITNQVDSTSGPSHVIGVALDGFLIYGSRDINGKSIPVSKLDKCNGIFSATPEYPKGIYHYVLPETSDSTSSIRCFHGKVDSSQIQAMPPMGPMPPMDQ